MSKPNTEFNLGLRDIDLIEDAINLVIARRSSAMSALAEDTLENTTDMSAYREIRHEVAELRELLGRLHNQKNWYRPQTDAVYVSGIKSLKFYKSSANWLYKYTKTKIAENIAPKAPTINRASICTTLKFGPKICFQVTILASKN